MSTAKQKSSKTLTEALDFEPSTVKKVNKMDSTKASKIKSSETAGPKETDESVEIEILENEENTSIKKSKIVKTKVIRDSFSFPQQDYLIISELKKTCLAEGLHVKKSEILRAGLHLLTKLNLAELKEAVDQIEKVKTGRPNASEG